MAMTKCPRCDNGQMAMEQDMHGKFWNCLQCGKNVDTEIFSHDAPKMVSITGRQKIDVVLNTGPTKYVTNFTMGRRDTYEGVDNVRKV